MRSLVAPIAMPILRFATRSYISGPCVADAMQIAHAAAERGYAATLCYWNEGLEDPHRVAARYRETLAAIESVGLDAQLAVKMPALWNRLDLVGDVVARARSQACRAVFDSHDVGCSETTFAALAALGPERLGCAIPGRWQRSLADAQRAIDLGVHVRVVKGQWSDPERPDIDMRQGFLGVIDRLAGRAVSVGVATHDPVLAKEALLRLAAAGTPRELELLYGLPIGPAADVARELGVRTRLYVPFGTAWLPYSVSRALERPSVLLRLARDLVRGRAGELPMAR
jgi:proline dehydrogenase